jgi:hypothetical protein
MALQGIDMLCDSNWGQNPGGLPSEPASTSTSLIDLELSQAFQQQVSEGVEAAQRPQLLSETMRKGN